MIKFIFFSIISALEQRKRRAFFAGALSLILFFNLLAAISNVYAIPWYAGYVSSMRDNSAANKNDNILDNNDTIEEKIVCGADTTNRLPIVYNNDYFSKSAKKYNLPLAVASLALEISSFSVVDVNENLRAELKKELENWKSVGEKKAISKDANVKDALRKLRFKDIESNAQYYNGQAQKDGIGVTVGSKKIWVGEKNKKEEYTLIPIVVRGGGYDSEWAGNFEVGNKGNHQGFDKASDKVKKFVDDYMKKMHITGKVKLWIVGYSRGGATAGLVGYKYNRSVDNHEFDKLGINLTKDNIYTYTFEAPNNFCKSKGYDEKDFKNIHNVVNNNDAVTKVPFASWGFSKVGVKHELKVDSKGAIEWRTNEILSKFDLKESFYYQGNAAEASLFGGFQNFTEYGQAVDHLTDCMDRAIGSMASDDNVLGKREYYSNNIQSGLMKFMYVLQRKGSPESNKLKRELGTLTGEKIILAVIVALVVDVKSVEDKVKNICSRFNAILDEYNLMDDKLTYAEVECLSRLFIKLDNFKSLFTLLYVGFNMSELENLHQPTVHLAILISYLSREPDEECSTAYRKYSKILGLTDYSKTNGSKAKAIEMMMKKGATATNNDISEDLIRNAFNKFTYEEDKARRNLLKDAEEMTTDQYKYVQQIDMSRIGDLNNGQVGNVNYDFLIAMPFTELTELFDYMLSEICVKGGQSLKKNFAKCIGNENKCEELLKSIKEYRREYKSAKECETIFGKKYTEAKNGFLNWFSKLDQGLKDRNLDWMKKRRNTYKSMDKIFKMLSEDLNLGLSRY